MERKYTHKLLKDLTEAKGISGDEKEVTRMMKHHLQDYADEFEYDNLGSLIALKKGSGNLKVMLAGHVDEVGFIVNKIEEDGFLRITPVGGWWTHVLLAKKVHVVNDLGEPLIGIVGSKPPHILKAEEARKVVERKDLYIDLGVKNKEAVQKLGVSIGNSVIPYSEYVVLNDPNFVCGKAMDNRTGVAVMIEVMKRLKNKQHEANVYSVGTVQEEVGLRGAKTATYKVKPDIAIAIDITMSSDTPGVTKSDVVLGSGVAISVIDGSAIGHKGFIKHLEKIAKEKNIPITHESFVSGGTDSGAIHKSFDGIVNVTLSVPCRYFHSHNSIINLEDYFACVDLISEFILSLDEKTYLEIKQANQ